MRRELILTSLFVALSFIGGRGQPTQTDDSLSSVAWLNVKNRGYSFLSFNFFPMKVIGVLAVNNDTLVFVPDQSAHPRGLKKRYDYNHLIKDLSIPLIDIKNVKSSFGVVIKTNAGKRYHFTINHPKAVVKKINERMNAIESSMNQK